MNKQFFKTDLAYQNWKSKYQYGNETPLESMIRAAKALASVETDKHEYWYARFLNTLVKFEGYEDNLENYSPEEQDVVKLYGKPVGLKTTLGGRILANIGTEYSGATLLNCFINGPVSNAKITYQRKVPNLGYEINIEKQTQDNPDSLANIMLTLLEQAETLKSEGGWGINFDWIRPRGSLIEGIGIEHPGVLKYMEIFDKTSEVIVQGNNDGYLDKLANHLDTDVKTAQRIGKKVKKMARKGAMMGVLSIWHPDIEEFVRAKQTPGRLTKFNISVMVDDKFMHAVKNDDYYDLHFNGEIYKRVKALDLYNLIMESTYNRAEPGVLFYDNMQKNNPLAYLGNLNATNPSLRGDMLVVTQKGIYPIKELSENKSLIENNKVLNFRGEWHDFIAFQSGKNKQLYKITLDDKTEIFCTPEHKWPKLISRRTKNNYDKRELNYNSFEKVETKNLKAGTKLYSPNYKEFFNAKNTKYEYNDGFVVGWLLGDGWISYHKRKKCLEYGFIVSEEELGTAGSIILNKLNQLGVSLQFRRSTKGNSYEVSTSNEAIRNYFSEMQIYHKNDVQSLQKLLLENFSESAVKGFIDGLFSSDGYVDKTNKRIVMTSKYKEILELLKRTLNFFDVSSTKIQAQTQKANFPNKKDYEGKTYTTNRLVIHGKNVDRFFNTFTLTSKHKQLNYENTKLNKVDNPNRQYKIVKTVELTNQYEDVYDLTVFDDTHTFLCEGNVITGNCGEIGGNPLTSTVCLLGSINLTQYVKPDRTFDFDTYTRDVETFARMLDNVNDLTYAPLPQYEWATKNVRQYGMGINGFASALYMMGISYSSEEAKEFADRVTWLKEEWTWRTSALLAKEKAPFPAYRKDAFESTYWFTTFTNISDHTKSLLKMYGARNGKTTTNPPLGNSSVISDNISNGLEPVFSKQYTRTYIAEKWPEGLTIDNVKNVLEEIKVGDATAWQGSYNGETYYYEPHNRGLCKVELVRDYGYEWVINNYVAEQSAEYLETAETLAVDDHVRIQEVFQRNCNQSISKTVNVPFEYSFNDFKNAYMSAWERGLNGFTTYRSGTMEAVLTAVEENKEDNVSQVEQVVKKDIKLPDEFLNGPMKVIKKEGKKFYINFSYLPEDINKEFPIALWIQTNSDGEVRQANQAVKKLADLLRKYEISEELIDKQIEKIKGNPAHMRLGKMVSMCLRHNLPLASVVASFDSLDEVYVTDLLFAVKKFLSENIEDGTVITGITCSNCKSTDIVFQSGCSTCRSCGLSNCG